jgi:hypothetical protein
LKETLIEKRRIPDAADPDPNPAPGPEQTRGNGSAAEPGSPHGSHPDGPEHPTTPYDHIWYDRRPLH